MAEERIQIEIANEGLEATIRVKPGEALSPNAVGEALAKAGIVFGIDANVVRTIEARIDDENFEFPAQRIARGRVPIPGKDGGIEFDVEVGVVAYKRRKDGTLDWFERNSLTCVEQGQDIGRVSPATPGRPGTTVDGEVSPAEPGRQDEPVLGDGIELTKEGRLVALRSGALSVRGPNQFDVLDHVEHPGDVDMASGNLETRGSLSVGGNVNDNFVVKTGGDLTVKGAVHGGHLDVGGHLHVGRGISPGEKGQIETGGDLSAHHAQMATLTVRGTTLIATDSIGNTIKTHSLEVGRRLFGGSATAECRIQTLDAGAPSGAGTKLRVAEPYTSARRRGDRSRLRRPAASGPRPS